MPISYLSDKKIFKLETDNTCYAFQIVKNIYPVHLYYGKKTDEIKEFSFINYAFAPYLEDDRSEYSPDVVMSEYVGFDSGDFRTSSIKIKNFNGDSVTFLRYKSYRIFKGRLELEGMPYAEADENTDTLEIILTDDLTGVIVNLYYTVFADCDVISRYVTVTNNGENDVTIKKIMSLTLDLPDHNFDMISLYGGHGRERNYQRNPLFYGNQNIFSRRGASSHHFNPFIALCRKDTSENSGEIYGFNFVYSGNFLDEVEVDQTGNSRVQIGLGSENFSWLLSKGDTFVAPEAVMTYSENGIGQMSRNFHNFTRNHILPPEPFENRPVVLNTWEACYFNIDENELLRFAESANECGIDMVVMDDGWFGARNNDNAALGDWFENKAKFKDGLKTFVARMKEKGIKFGIWIEPEMINPDSDLYRAHPEWCLQCKKRESMLSRDQLVLDMANPDVINYLKDIFSKTFDGVAIDYFKWDMNRHMSQVGSNILPPERQNEAAHRYMLGVYDLFRWFNKKFPCAMIENCSGGGGRYDLGMMKYSTMIWTSDNTCPCDRIGIQYSSMLAYPAATMSCHVAHLENCEIPERLKYIYEVALGGPLGYELHLPNSSVALKNAVKTQIENYRKYEDLIIRGDYYTVMNPFETNCSVYYFTNENGDRILLSFLQVNPEETQREITFKVDVADSDFDYYDEISGETISGEDLQKGITVSTDNSGWNSHMWYLIKK